MTSVIRMVWTPIVRVFGRWRHEQTAAVVEACAPAGGPCDEPTSASVQQADDFVSHLEFLGYSLEASTDGWCHMRHPNRYNFSVRPTEVGLRMHCAITIGALVPGAREAWLEFVNSANDRSLVGRFALVVNDEGEYSLRVRHLFSCVYERRAFGAVVDMWHEDLALLRYAPPPDQPAEEEAEEEAPATVVH